MSPSKSGNRVHSELCERSTVREKCPMCFREYKAKQKRLERKRKKVSHPKTRSVTVNSRSKYFYIHCENCENKQFNELCVQCRKKYKCAVSKTARIKKMNNEINSKQTDIVSPSASGSILDLDKTAIVSNSAPTKGQINNNAKRKLNYIDDLKGVKKNKPVIKQNSVKSIQCVSDRLKQSNHKKQLSFSNETTKIKKKQNIKCKEKTPSKSQSDLNNEKTPEKIYSEKTLRNSKCKLNKQFT